MPSGFTDHGNVFDPNGLGTCATRIVFLVNVRKYFELLFCNHLITISSETLRYYIDYKTEESIIVSEKSK